MLAALSEEEMYLYCILQDPASIDLAEFTWRDFENDDNCWRAWAFQWCFAAGTMVLTKTGHKPIERLVGEATLLTEASNGGKWVDAEVRSFGPQRIVELEVERYGWSKTIRTTAEHIWFASAGRKGRRKYPSVRTVDLEPGMFLRGVYPHRSVGTLKVDPYGVVHGLVWGDGTKDANGGCHLNLWGEKLVCAEYLLGDGSVLNPDVAAEGRSWSLLPIGQKEPVRLDGSPSYLYGWLAGYFAADGSVSPDGTCQITSADTSSLELVRDVCLRLGITVGPVTEAERQDGYRSGLAPDFTVTIVSSELDSKFFLLPSHRRKWSSREGQCSYSPRDWKVVSIRSTQDIEEVYCAIVPDTHSFVLDGYILTGNCWWRCPEQRQLDQCSRSVGKSTGIAMRAFGWPFRSPGQQMAIIAPQLNHLRPLNTLIEQRLTECRITREMMRPGVKAITHPGQAIHVDFLNGATLFSRIPQGTGAGVKGIHPKVLECDESQDLTEATWNELIETVKRQTEGSKWLIHGVTRGVQDKFFKFSQPGSGWTVHRITAMSRPGWNDEERQNKIAEYGGYDSPHYKRNVLGQHGDQSSPLFTARALFACVDDDELSDFNVNEYRRIDVYGENLIAPGDILYSLDHPANHTAGKYERFWVGVDLGHCVDEDTEIFTQRGWLRHDEVVIGDRSLAIDPETGLSGWQEITDLYSCRGNWDMIHMKGQTFDAKTTPNHKWLVHYNEQHKERLRWRTTETLNTKDRIPLAAPRGDAPVEPVYSDDFVELAGWFMTEGSVSKSGIAQRASQALTTAIRGRDKVPSMEFLLSLTVPQLRLFLSTCVDGDGHVSDSASSVGQGVQARIAALQAVAALAGMPASLGFRKREAGRPMPNGTLSGESDEWLLRMLACSTVGPVAAADRAKQVGLTELSMTIHKEQFQGVIWCPTLKHHNWLARRGHATYFTGNTVSPSEIMVLGEYKPKSRDQDSVLRALLRVHLMRVAMPEQLQAMLWVIASYAPAAFGMDATGAGLPYVQMIQNRLEENEDPQLRKALETIRGYDFGSKIVVDFDQNKDPDQGEDNEIKRNVGDFSFDTLRVMVDNHRLELPWDREMISEFQGSSFTVTSSTGPDQYGRRNYQSSRADHCLVGDTLVETWAGQKRIADVLIGDLVVTRFGWRRVLDSRQVGMSAVLTATTLGGRSVCGTLDHRIWTDNRGWTALGEVALGDRLLCRQSVLNESNGLGVHGHDTPIPSGERIESITRRSAVRCADAEPAFVDDEVSELSSLSLTQVPVYDLTVEHSPEFFANGILVHNCLDAFRMAVLGYQQHKIEEMLRPQKRESVYLGFVGGY